MFTLISLGRLLGDDDQPPYVDALSIERERRFIDDERREWRVRESDLGSYDRRTGRSLIFETENAARRLRTFPENWYALTDVELYSLSLAPTRQTEAVPLQRVCLFNSVDGPIVVELTPDALSPRIYHDGLEYCRHILTLLTPSNEVEDVTFYSVMPPSSDERSAISRALFGDRGGE